MKAAVITRYGRPDTIAVREMPKPVPKTRDICVAVHATAVGRTDCGMLAPHPPLLGRLMYGLFRPKHRILGMDFAGVVETIGREVTRFKPGDRVFGMLRLRELGAQADYVCLADDGYIATMPDGLSFEQAVVCEGAFYAQACLTALNLKAGSSILIYGASGAIGSAAVQLAKSQGAQVTAVAATRHLTLIKSLGADRVIDYTQEDFTRIGERFDGLLDAVGKTTYLRCRKLLKPDAKFVGTDFGPWCQTLLFTLFSMITGRGRVTIPFPKNVSGFVDFLKAKMEANEFRVVIDRRYSLDNIADAYRYVEKGQKTGIVIVNVTSQNGEAQPEIADN